ncbi:MAG: long-chain fatty acid--CoA ligase [Rhodothermales bacterium]
MTRTIYTAPAGTGTPVLGKTLPQLLYEAADRYSNRRALNQPSDLGWIPFSIEDFKRHAEETAFGLLEIGLQKGDRVALYMESDVRFCVADMGCLIGGMIDVPIYLTHGPDQIQYVIKHSEAAVVVVSTMKHLHEIHEVLRECPMVRHVIVAQIADEEILPALPARIKTYTLGDIRARGRRRRAEAGAVEKLLEDLSPRDLATIIYTSGTTGNPKGVMLSHENVSFNALTSFSGLPDYRPGADGEVTISFLPLSHVFARALHYGFLYHGTSVFFTSPENLGRDLRKVKPTIFASVPRVIEKVYGSILEKMADLSPVRKGIAQWALHLGERFELGEEPEGLYHVELDLANKLVFRKWREALGGQVKYIIAGGAALSPRLANLFAAAGITVLQGYGLTETSPVISFNRPDRNLAGTVGEPIPGVEVAIAEDGEILTRGPHVMMGYFKDEERTREVIDEEGWLHTGDIGEMTVDGYLKITDRKKDLFKLSTGKYVMPQPIENRLITYPLVEQAVVVGSDNKYCTALIFPEQQRLKAFARSQGLDASRPAAELIEEDLVKEQYKKLVEAANEGMDPWSQIKRFRLLVEHLTPENEMLTPTMKVRRSRVQKRFESEVDAMYEDDAEEKGNAVVVDPNEQQQHHAA